MAKALSARIQAVRARHKAVDELLHHEQTRPQTRSDWITSLKRDKLKLKDELARLERQLDGGTGSEAAGADKARPDGPRTPRGAAVRP